MQKRVIKTSAIWIAHGRKTKVYQSVDEVPPGLRRKLEESISGPGSKTILIADRNGREEIRQTLQGNSPEVQNPPSFPGLVQSFEANDPSATGWRTFWKEAVLLAAAAAGLLRFFWGRS